ncbi:hypothetical protein D3C80_1510220 [compost metagenome]
MIGFAQSQRQAHVNMRRQPRQNVIDRLFDSTQLNHPNLPCIPWYGVGPSLPGLCCIEQPVKNHRPTQKPCRSEHAREGLSDAAGFQVRQVIVNDHREQARSYSKQQKSQAQKSRSKAASSRKRRAGYRPDISLMAPFSSSSEQSAQVPLGGIALIPVMALARMPSRPPW